MSIEMANCMRRFMRICGDGFEQGWHERNGGNLSYRMDEEDIEVCMPYLSAEGEGREWAPLGIEAPQMAGEMLIVTGAGKYMRKVPLDPHECLGIVQINAQGNAYRKVWGLADGGKPTSELPTHVLNHAVRAEATAGKNRVIYHAHCPHVIALSTVIEPDARTWSRILWKSMTECVMVFPQGVGVLPWMVPGGTAIARATSDLMRSYEACVWTQHGLFVSGSDCDDAFGLMHCIEKAAQLYLEARAACGGAEPPFTVSDAQLCAVCESLGVTPNEAFLD